MRRDYNIYLIDDEMSLYQIFDYDGQNYKGKYINDETGENTIDIEYIAPEEIDDYPLHPQKSSGEDIYIFNIGYLKTAEYMEYEY